VPRVPIQVLDRGPQTDSHGVSESHVWVGIWRWMRLPQRGWSTKFSSPFPSPAPNILQRLPFSSDYQRLPFSSTYYSLQPPPAPYHSPATLRTFFLQILPFMLIHKPLFRLCPTEAIIVKSASIISNVVRAVDSGLVNISQKEGWTKIPKGDAVCVSASRGKVGLSSCCWIGGSNGAQLR
jgi:hypothetical protein